MSSSTRMTPLRHAMIQQMSDRHFAPRTLRTYVYWVSQIKHRGNHWRLDLPECGFMGVEPFNILFFDNRYKLVW